MRLLRFLVLTALLTTSASAQHYIIHGRRPAPAAGGCVTNTGNLLSESFDPTGYDNTWSEPQDTPDEDSTTNPPVGSETHFCTQALFIDSTGAREFSRHSLSAAESELWLRFYLYVDDEFVDDAKDHIIFAACPSGAGTSDSSGCMGIALSQTTGTIEFSLMGAANQLTADTGATEFTYTLDTEYQIEFHARNSDNLVEWWIDNSSIGTATYSGFNSDLQDIQAGFGHTLSGNGGNIYFDNVDVDNTGRVTD